MRQVLTTILAIGMVSSLYSNNVKENIHYATVVEQHTFTYSLNDYYPFFADVPLVEEFIEVANCEVVAIMPAVYTAPKFVKQRPLHFARDSLSITRVGKARYFTCISQ